MIRFLVRLLPFLGEMLWTRRREMAQQGSLNGFIFGLIVLAVALSATAMWQRHSLRGRLQPGDTADPQASSIWSSFGSLDGWIPTGSLPQSPSTSARCRFVCPQCQSSCLTHARHGCPACPICGQGMVRQGLQVALVGGLATESTAFPITIQAGALRPHVNRGPCTNCHTVAGSGVFSSGQMPVGAGQGNPQSLWNGVAAPAIRPGAVAPTLIKEFGMEVLPAPGGLKVTGVMGNSYASRAGLGAGDIIIECNGTVVRDIERFQQVVAKAAPEANAQIKVLRNSRTRDLSIMVGEGEMEGFTPIQ